MHRWRGRYRARYYRDVTDPPGPKKTSSLRAGAEIVDAILVAAEALIAADGLARFTTNRVAERAGVSVGSLYQYFPNKEAILAELARRLERRSAAELLEVFERSAADPLEVVVERVVDVLLVGIGATRFRRALREIVPPGWTVEASAEVDASVRDRIHRELARRSDVRAGAHPLMAWVIAHAIEGAVEAMVLADPATVTSTAFRDELCELALRYLRR